jgi:hypothetical protein
MIDVSCEDILRNLAINRFVETGTDMGETVALVSRWFSEQAPDFGRVTDSFQTGERAYDKWNKPIQFPRFSDCGSSNHKVYSVDLDSQVSAKARAKFDTNPNIVIVNSSSEKFLSQLLKDELPQPKNNYFFFLDAHWGKYWPIRDELKVISQLPRFIIAIDDFFVPGKSDVRKSRGDFGFDFYHRRVLSWGYIHDCFANKAVRVFYPLKPNRDRRGWCVITHGYTPEQLAFLTEKLGLYETDSRDSEHVRLIEPELQTYWDTRVILRMLFPLKFLRQGFQLLQSFRGS